MFKRMLKDPALRVFLIHVIGFVVVVGAAAALNLYATPDHIWFIWLLAGWGIAACGARPRASAQTHPPP